MFPVFSFYKMGLKLIHVETVIYIACITLKVSLKLSFYLTQCITLK